MARATVPAFVATALLACGQSETTRATPTPTATAMPVAAAAAPAPSPPTERPDGKPWARPPKALKRAVGGPVVVAADATEEEAAATGCIAPSQGGTFVRAIVDDFLLHTSYRGEAEVAGEPGTPVLSGCVATWREDEWRKSETCDGGYAPLTSIRAVTLSGGGLRYCQLGSHRLARLWIVPPHRARWIVIRRGKYAVAYPVRTRLPVNVTYRVRRTGQSPRRLRFDSVTANGRRRSHSVEGAVAG